MKSQMRAILIISLFLVSCGPAWHLRRAELKGAKVTTDTVFQIVQTIVPMVKHDSVFTSLPGDTVRITKDRLSIKYVRLPGDSVYIEGKCDADTVKIKVIHTVTKTVKAGYTGWKLVGMIIFGLVAGFIVRMAYQAMRK
jgi:hypothetical protein